MGHSTDDELFDVVNEHDEFVEIRPRVEVHALNLNHRAVHGFIFNKQHQMFLQKRSMSKDCHPGVWDSSFSGHVDAGETYDQACMREIHEELGIVLDMLPEKVLKVDACEDTGFEFTWLYKIHHEGPFVLHPEEIDDGKWIDIEGLRNWISNHREEFAPSFLCLWTQFELITSNNPI